MFKKICFLMIGFIQVLNATSLDSILESIETNNYSLKSKQKIVDSSVVDAELSNLWSNPVLGLGVSDINLDEPSKRDIEAMQTQFITYSQNIPTNGKLALSHDIKQNDIKIKQLEYIDFKQKLKSQALVYAYTIYYQQKKLQILSKYIQNLNDQKELMNLLYETGKLDQSKLVNIDIKIYKFHLQKQKLRYQISQIQLQLENLVYEKIDSIEITKRNSYINDDNTNIQNIINNHPLILIEKEKIKKQSQKIELENRKKIADVKLNVGYYQRENFDDYVSFNIAIPLSVQGIEKLKIKKNKINKLAIEDNLKSLENQLETTIKNLEQKMFFSQENFELIENKMIPLNDTLEQSHKIHLSTNRMQSLEVYESTNSKFELVLLAYDEKIIYFSARSQLYYFKGKI